MKYSLTKQGPMEALFLDRDGIINEVVMREGVVSSPRNLVELKIREEFVSFYEKIAPLKIPLFVVSNQPDVARKKMSQENLDSLTESILKRFPQLRISYCIHDESDLCLCRKPKPGLIEKELKKYRLESQKCLLIGDSHKDIEAGLRAGVLTALLRTPYNKEPMCNPDFTIGTLMEIFRS